MRGDSEALRRHETAAEWLVRLQDADVPDSAWEDWQRWLDASPDNLRAFDEAIHTLRHAAAWRDALADLPLASVIERSADQYAGEKPVADWLQKGGKSGSAWARRAALAAGLAAAALLAALLPDRPRMPESGAGQLQAWQTSDAEHRDIPLADGSRVILGAESALTVNYSAQSRAVVLENGEALFTVAKDPDRPFVVVASSGTIRAVGTAFNVRRESERVVVTVTEGRVAVEMRSAEAPQGTPSATASSRAPLSATVTRGERVVYDGSHVGPVEPADLEIATAWRFGRLQYRAEPLRYVVDGVNRYSAREIIIADRRVGEMRFTGSVFNAHIDEWLDGLEQVFPVEVVEIGDSKVLLRYALPPSQ